jgi:uroporphyrinogen decarboxylase
MNRENIDLLDGIHGLVPRDRMTNGARKMRDTYAITPGAPLYKREFGYYCIDRWRRADGLPENADFSELFDYDDAGRYSLEHIGWCEAEFLPYYEEKILEDRGEYEVVQDYAGRAVLCFKGRRSGFMPEYLDHPVKDWKTWEENVKWRMNPDSAERYFDLPTRMQDAKDAARKGLVIVQNLVGSYMYLRSLIGPTELLYMFYDSPDLIHDCMKTWFALADRVIGEHQKHVTIDEIFFGEDICYNHGPLISPEMMHEFILPYYQQLIANLRARQIDKTRHLYIQIDTDGFAPSVIPMYKEIGMDIMSPFEVASGCDVVQVGKQYPDLVIVGGIDKRVLAQGKKEIDAHLEYILPTMRERGGYIPTCDHGVPEEVSLENYLYYRKRAVELGG